MKTPSRKFLIVCGGTGGHLAPGVALAERLVRRGHACRLVVSKKDVDRRFSRKYTELDFEAVPGVGLSFTLLGVFRFLVGFVGSVIGAERILRHFRPDVTIAFGGFLSPPFVLLSRARGISVVVHESNRRPGKSVRLLARLAHRVYLPTGVRIRGIRRSKVSPCGYPLRREIQHLAKEEARRRWGLKNRFKTLVVIGGSQGAMALNEWVNANLATLGREGLNVIAVSGPQKGVESKIELETEHGGKVLAWFLPFTDEMSLLLSIADLVLSRAGAGAIAELTACLAPSVLIPYPFAADQHQDANAHYFERQGGCVVVDQKDIDKRLLAEVQALIFNDSLLNSMRGNLRALSVRDVGEEMATELEQALRHGDLGPNSGNSSSRKKEAAA